MMDELQVDLEILKIESKITALLRMRITLNETIYREIEKLEEQKKRIKKNES